MAQAEGGLKAKIFDWAFGVGLQGRRGCGARADRCRPAAGRADAVADKLVFSKIRARFGGRIRFFVSGSAALSPGGRGVVRRRRHADPRGLRADRDHRPAAASTGRSTYRFGTVGPPLPGTEVKIADGRRDPDQGRRA